MLILMLISRVCMDMRSQLILLVPRVVWDLLSCLLEFQSCGSLGFRPRQLFALSTMEAEVNALAACMRELIPIINMVKELIQSVGLQAGDMNMNVLVHEDNSGALVLAETLPPQFTSRSKYYATKTIWFCEEIHKRGIKLKKFETSEQLGDIFTKGLTQATFEYLRAKIVGW